MKFTIQIHPLIFFVLFTLFCHFIRILFVYYFNTRDVETFEDEQN